MHSSQIAIKIDKISKRYRIGSKENLSDSVLLSALNFFKSPIKNYQKYRSLYTFEEKIDKKTGEINFNSDKNIIWALKNISTEIKTGDVVGIIGRNGAGKSTLLKILSKIVSPSFGSVKIKGKVSSLLEVGTGFHPELTGRENIYMNGTILGMRKKEIDRKFDKIVEFSGIEQFLDTPVKRYSSGMSVRLAFSVAAHLEPEILIIDEVLAVGDMDFQKKSLSKMEEVGKEGRTVLFVSHNLPAVARLCNRAILIEQGQITMDGSSGSVVHNYMTNGKKSTAEAVLNKEQSYHEKDIAILKAVRILDDTEKINSNIKIDKEFSIEMEYNVLKPGYKLLPHFGLLDINGQHIFITADQDPEWKSKTMPTGSFSSRVWIPGNFLAEGMIYINCSLITLNPASVVFDEPSIVSCLIIETNEENSSRGEYSGTMPGVIRPLLKWKRVKCK